MEVVGWRRRGDIRRVWACALLGRIRRHGSISKAARSMSYPTGSGLAAIDQFWHLHKKPARFLEKENANLKL